MTRKILKNYSCYLAATCILSNRHMIYLVVIEAEARRIIKKEEFSFLLIP
jgi:hypothetical protein